MCLLTTSFFFFICLFSQVARPYSSAGNVIPVDGEQSKNFAKAFPSAWKTLHSCHPGELQLHNMGCAGMLFDFLLGLQLMWCVLGTLMPRNVGNAQSRPLIDCPVNRTVQLNPNPNQQSLLTGTVLFCQEQMPLWFYFSFVLFWLLNQHCEWINACYP